MSRQMRTLVILGGLALLAVVALGMMAKRYSTLGNKPVSVDDAIQQQKGKNEPFAEAPALDPQLTSSAKAAEDLTARPKTEPEDELLANAEENTAVSSEGMDTESVPQEVADASKSNLNPEIVQELEVFIDIRKRYKEMLDEHPDYVRQMKLEIDDRLDEQQKNPSFFTTNVKLYGNRLKWLAEHDMPVERYREIRELFRAYMANETINPEWNDAFDSERERLTSLYWGQYEMLDL